MVISQKVFEWDNANQFNPAEVGTDCTILYASKATSVRINKLALSHLNAVWDITTKISLVMDL